MLNQWHRACGDDIVRPMQKYFALIPGDYVYNLSRHNYRARLAADNPEAYALFLHIGRAGTYTPTISVAQHHRILEAHQAHLIHTATLLQQELIAYATPISEVAEMARQDALLAKVLYRWVADYILTRDGEGTTIQPGKI